MAGLTKDKATNDVKTVKGLWSEEEDKFLLGLIEIYGPSRWVEISQKLKTRTAKQCRERYHQNLRPNLNKSPISREEGERIKELVARHGYRWTFIAKLLNTNRSDNSIKNWWKTNVKRKKKAQIELSPSNKYNDAGNSFFGVLNSNSRINGSKSCSVTSSSDMSSPDSGGLSDREGFPQRRVEHGFSTSVDGYVGNSMQIQTSLDKNGNRNTFGSKYNSTFAQQIVPSFGSLVPRTTLVPPVKLGVLPPIISPHVLLAKPSLSNTISANVSSIHLQDKHMTGDFSESQHVQEILPNGRANSYRNDLSQNGLHSVVLIPEKISTEKSPKTNEKIRFQKLPTFEELRRSMRLDTDSKR